MPKLVEYAVRVKGTSKYLPRPQRRDGRGGSHLQPVDFSDRSSWPKGYEKNMQIRSYTDKRAAVALLNAWLQGKFVAHRGGYEDDYWEETEVIPQKDRVREDMEVVEIEIFIK